MTTQRDVKPQRHHLARGKVTVANLPAGYLSISDAAHELGLSVGDVVRLIDDQRIETVELIAATSLAKYKESAA